MTDADLLRIYDFEDADEQRQRAWQYHSEAKPEATRWLIKNVLPETGVGLLSGQWGAYKTTTALDISVAIMTGTPFAGRFPIKRRGGVAFLAAEGASGLRSRLDAVARERGVKGSLPFAWRSDCPPLTAPNALDTLAACVDEASKHLKAQFDLPLALVWIDTIIAAAAYTKSGDDSDATAAQKVMSVLAGLSQRACALVMGVDHFGKVMETGTRGSSAKEGHADVVLAALADRVLSGHVTKTRLALRKLREGPAGLEIHFTAKTVTMGTDQDGDAISRVVIDWTPPLEAIRADKTKWAKSLQLLRRVLMSTITENGEQVRPFPDGPVVRACNMELMRNEFYKQWPADGSKQQKSEARRKAFNRAIRDAQDKSLIAIREIDGVQLVWLANPTKDEPSC